MENPFRFIESKVTSRKEFIVTEGYQATWAILYIKSGSFDITIDGKTVSAGKSDCLVLPDNVRFSRRVSSPLEFLYIKFMPNEKSRVVINIPIGVIATKDSERITEDFALMESAENHSDGASVSYLEHLLNDMLFCLYYKNKSGASEDTALYNDDLVDKAIKYITDNADKSIREEDICKGIGTNISTLSWRFNKITGGSVWEYVLKIRLDKAKKLLRTTTFSVSSVAEKCGYDNIYYFSNAFKKYTGFSPSSYRKAQNPIY